jgi:hypothetical protein
LALRAFGEATCSFLALARPTTDGSVGKLLRKLEDKRLVFVARDALGAPEAAPAVWMST